MSRPSLRLPLGVLAVGIALILLLLLRPDDQRLAYSQSAQYPGSSQGPYSAPSAATATMTATQTITPTAEVTPTAAVTTVTPLFQSPTALPPTPTRPRATPLPPTATPTATPDPGLECIPGTMIEIRGAGPPRAPILLYFDRRIVGGGSVNSAGRFALPLRVGKERPGSYTVSVRVRGSSQELLSEPCVVPDLPPTPTVPRLP